MIWTVILKGLKIFMTFWNESSEVEYFFYRLWQWLSNRKGYEVHSLNTQLLCLQTDTQILTDTAHFVLNHWECSLSHLMDRQIQWEIVNLLSRKGKTERQSKMNFNSNVQWCRFICRNVTWTQTVHEYKYLVSTERKFGVITDKCQVKLHQYYPSRELTRVMLATTSWRGCHVSVNAKWWPRWIYKDLGWYNSVW
jgi:hypothetical protein